jgi:uncharacterized protein YecT (DUF1311 family)
VRAVLALGVILASFLTAQDRQAAKKQAKQQWDAYYAQVARFRQEAKAAFDREMAGEKAGECRHAGTTMQLNSCFGQAVEAARASYKAFTGAIRSMLGLALEPSDAAEAKATVDAFDATEAAWQKYREAQCKAALDLYKGGTIAPSQAMACELLLTRNHMLEIEQIYYMRLNN